MVDWDKDCENQSGIDLTAPALNHQLAYVNNDERVNPFVDVGTHRLGDIDKSLLDVRYGDYFKWKEHWYDLPANVMRARFSLDEQCKIIHNSCIMSELGQFLEKEPEFRMLYKVRNALWHWSHGQSNYNLFVYWYTSLKRFNFGLADTEVKFDYTTYFNRKGYSWHSRTYIDSPFAYLVYYKGKHVLTISFAPSCEGLLINQVQLKEKKGNRWLYKLPCHVIDYAIERMAEAFHDCPLWFVDGKSLAAKMPLNYAPECRDQWDAKNGKRIADMYNRKLVRFKRTRQKHEVERLTYYRLSDTHKKLALEWFDEGMKHIPFPKEKVA